MPKRMSIKETCRHIEVSKLNMEKVFSSKKNKNNL